MASGMLERLIALLPHQARGAAAANLHVKRALISEPLHSRIIQRSKSKTHPTMKPATTTLSSSPLSPLLANQLHRHFLTCSAAAACVAGTVAPQQADAAIVYSGLRNLALPATTGAQLYINFVTGATGANAAALPDWDMAPYGAGLRNQPSYAAVTVLLGADTANLPSGADISNASNLAGATGGILNVLIPSGTTGYIGFKFNPDSLNGFTPAPNGTPTNFGWMRMTTNTGGGGTVIDWAYESTPGVAIAAGAIPEPSSLACLAMGALGLASLRRRQKMAA